MNNDAWPKTKEEAVAFFKEHYASAVPLLGGMDSACNQLLAKPAGLLGTVRTSAFNYGGKALLIGDAAHAIVPFFGQGCNCGFEDCVVLEQVVREGGRGERDAILGLCGAGAGGAGGR